jgi:hypothetical protein
MVVQIVASNPVVLDIFCALRTIQAVPERYLTRRLVTVVVTPLATDQCLGRPFVALLTGMVSDAQSVPSHTTVSSPVAQGRIGLTPSSLPGDVPDSRPCNLGQSHVCCSQVLTQNRQRFKMLRVVRRWIVQYANHAPSY